MKINRTLILRIRELKFRLRIIRKDSLENFKLRGHTEGKMDSGGTSSKLLNTLVQMDMRTESGRENG